MQPQFLVTKLIRYCPTHRLAILSEFQGHVLRMLLHRHASRVIADSFELYANAAGRGLLLRDFYGKEVALFESKTTAEGGAASLQSLLENAEPERRTRILNALKENILLM